MDKIKALMEKMGFSSDLSTELVKLLNDHVDKEKKTLHEDTANKLKQVKEACLKAYQEEINRISRGVGVYLEHKSERIEKSKLNQLAIEESQSAEQLKKVKALLENVDITKLADKDGQAQAERKLSLLEAKLERITKEKTDLGAKLQQANAIAERAIRRAMVSETAKAEPVQAKATVVEGKTEGKDTKVKKPETLNEEKQKVAPASQAKIAALEPEEIAKFIQ